ncbi:type IV pilus twitching motility protein PilT [Fibrobacter sp. UWEL]|uniref:type IV pilus twitching motility protein PilT n=1 Tax=Fibrobacter sp. UWEL TaxID=1896209 RepID=UPI00091B4CF0|nr:type IV pilus twitching motility protein PilT [Fibrobacter sp. UWEL]SHL32906.1 twitching motility protein PilT [Fibrobacter sp. UWEL]
MADQPQQQQRTLRIEQLLREMVNHKASDLHIRVGVPPVYRINGSLQKLFDIRVDGMMMDSFLDDIMNREQKQRFEANKECDFAVGARDMGRFRVNVFRQRGTIAIVIRHIKAKIPPFEELHLPEVIRELALTKRGLILVTGTTGSGKSTTLASMLDYINQTETVNIITVEDPIEYLYKDNKAIISQREIGVDTLSYANALRAALRQDPDVLLVGEIRDLETMQIAMTAADTGHMVFATIHTTNATETIHRVLSMYPPHQHDEIRLLLGEVLAGIISLRLLPTKDGNGRVPAAEILVNSGAIREYIQDKTKNDLIEQAIAEGHMQYHSQTFDQALLELYGSEQISLETAMSAATNPDDFDLKIRGISGTSERGWM